MPGQLIKTTGAIPRALLAALMSIGCAGAHALGADYGYDSFKTPDAVDW
ncbi:MAG: hypothetical protein JWQ73_1831, partial [Variovorax sp.]|nr:hypothetical protein [Variovorax sp.]